MHDEELKKMLGEWRTPEAPPNLRARALAPRKGWQIIPSHLRVPTPVAALMLAAMFALGFFAAKKPESSPPTAAHSSLASFQAAPDLNLRVVRLPHEND